MIGLEVAKEAALLSFSWPLDLSTTSMRLKWEDDPVHFSVRLRRPS